MNKEKIEAILNLMKSKKDSLTEKEQAHLKNALFEHKVDLDYGDDAKVTSVFYMNSRQSVLNKFGATSIPNKNEVLIFGPTTSSALIDHEKNVAKNVTVSLYADNIKSKDDFSNYKIDHKYFKDHLLCNRCMWLVGQVLLGVGNIKLKTLKTDDHKVNAYTTTCECGRNFSVLYEEKTVILSETGEMFGK